MMHALQQSKRPPLLLRLLVFWLTLLCAGASFAFGPKDALLYTGPETAAAGKKIMAAKSVLAAQRFGVGSQLGANRREDENGYTLSLQYRNDPVAVVQARRSLAQAQTEMAVLQRAGICDALLAHAELWSAQARAQAAQTRLTAAQLAKDEVARKLILGAASDLDAEAAAVELADAELAIRDTAKTLTSAKANCACFKLTGTADPDVLRFSLPQASIEEAQDYRDLKWNLDIAKEQQRAARRQVTPGLGLELSYVGSEYTLTSSLSSRTRTVNVLAGYPSLYNDPSVLLWAKGWQSTLQIELPIDILAWANARSAKAEVTLAQAQLDRKKELLEIKLAQARSAAETAAGRMDLAKQRLQLAARKVVLAEARERAGAISNIAVLHERAACADIQATVADAWKAYIEATATYLEMTGGQWKELP